MGSGRGGGLAALDLADLYLSERYSVSLSVGGRCVVCIDRGKGGGR